MLGELGLIYRRPRAATCLALTELDLAIMDRAHFQKSFDKIQKYSEHLKRCFFEDYVIKEKEIKFLAPKFGIMFERKNIQAGTKLI